MFFRKKNRPPPDRTAELMEGIDAVGTIVDQDLALIRTAVMEIQEQVGRLHAALSKLSLDLKGLENGQGDLMAEVKSISERLNWVEVRLAEGLTEPK